MKKLFFASGLLGMLAIGMAFADEKSETALYQQNAKLHESYRYQNEENRELKGDYLDEQIESEQLQIENLNIKQQSEHLSKNALYEIISEKQSGVYELLDLLVEKQFFNVYGGKHLQFDYADLNFDDTYYSNGHFLSDIAVALSSIPFDITIEKIQNNQEQLSGKIVFISKDISDEDEQFKQELKQVLGLEEANINIFILN